MDEQRRQAGLIIEKAAKGIKNTETLLQSFYPNVARIMQEKQLRNSIRIKQMDEEQKLSVFWQKVKEQALDRKETDCSICYSAFVSYKETALLDCSHMFHGNCLRNFEKFDREARDGLPQEGQHSCPMCRQPNYKKIIIKL